MRHANAEIQRLTEDRTRDANWKRWPARSTSLHCNDVTSSTINVPVDIAGGPRWVDLCFRDETDSEQQLACEGYPHP